MKEQLFMNKNEGGYFFPLVLFVVTVLFATVATSTIIYKNEIEIVDKLMEQLHVETIIQMSKVKFQSDALYENENTGNVNYIFPPGDVNINYSMIDSETVLLQMLITTNKSTVFRFNVLLTIE